jgi:choline-sulfatase
MKTTRREFAKGLGSAGMAPALARGGAAARHPNILFVVSDQWSGVATDLSGKNPTLRTPAMDTLAAGGARFGNAYCTYPLCSPSRASLFTGRMPHETGVVFNLRPNSGVVPPDMPTLGELFSAAGYDTGYFGKEHIGGAGYRGFSDLGSVRFAWGGYLADGNMLDPVFVRDAMEFIRKPRNKPFLAAVSLINPHDICYQPPYKNIPVVSTVELCTGFREGRYLRGLELPPPPANVQAPPPSLMPGANRIRKSWTDKEWRLYLATYYLLIENTNWLIGRLLDAVRTSGLENNTLILFTADHGDQMGAHQLVGKGMFYEESARVPFVISWKGVIKPGQVDNSHLISGVDVFPTLCDYAGVRTPDGLPGRSVRALLENAGASWRDYLVAETPDGRMLRSGSDKYMVFHADGNPEFLFDLDSDSGETENLAASPTARRALEKNRKLLAAWTEETGGSFEQTLRLNERRRSFYH